MAEIHSIDKQRQADRRTALLALHAGKEEDGSACLSDEQLACLADGNCSGKEREVFLQHLAGCLSCYHHWVELCELVAGKEAAGGEKRKILPMVRPGYMAWAGTLLAAAASVVLYLNIDHKVAGPVLHEQPPAAVKKAVPAPVASPGEQAQPLLKKNIPSNEAGPNSLQYQEAEAEMSMTDTLPAPALDSKQEQATALRSAARKSAGALRTSPMAAGVKDKVTATATGSEFMVLLEKLEQGCRGRAEGPEFWKARLEEAETVAETGSPEERQVAGRLLPLLQELAENPAVQEQVCPRMESVLNDR